LPGAYYPSSEKPKLAKFNPMFEKLATGSACFVFEKDVFSDPIKIPWLGEGKDLGYIMYHGQMKGSKTKEAEEEIQKETPLSQDLIKQALIEALNTLKPAQAGGLS
jgi:hypothetical protein